MKVALRPDHSSLSRLDERYEFIQWKSCLPFLENKRAVLIHRPRAIATVSKSAIMKNPYFIANMWCGTSMTNSDNHWTFLEAPPDGKIICARCEFMATQRGLPSSDSIVGHHVHIGGVKAFISCCEGIE